MSNVETWDLFEDGEHAGQHTGTAEQAAEHLKAAIMAQTLTPSRETIWIDWMIRSGDAASSGTLTIDPDEPLCAAGRDHDWQHISTRGNGGGVVLRYVCPHCGAYRVTDSWAQRPDTGEQGLTSVEYLDDDESSREMVAGTIIRAMVAALDADDRVISYDEPGKGADRIDGVELAEGVDADAWMSEMEAGRRVSTWQSERGEIELTAEI